MLRGYDWPGNVRKLQSALFRAAVLCERDALTPEEFPQISAAVGVPRYGGSGGAGTNDGIGVTLYENDGNMRPLEEIEADVIRLAIGHYRGRMTEVARRLGIQEIATTDSNFDHIQGFIVYKPRDLAA